MKYSPEFRQESFDKILRPKEGNVFHDTRDNIAFNRLHPGRPITLFGTALVVTKVENNAVHLTIPTTEEGYEQPAIVIPEEHWECVVRGSI